MAVTPSGVFNQPLVNLATLLSNVEAWQTWCDADDAAEALAHIYYVAVDGTDIEEEVPLAMISHSVPAEWTSTMIGAGAGQTFQSEGSIELVIVDLVASANQASSADAEFAFTNSLSSVIAGMRALSGTNAYLNITEISVLMGPQRLHPDQRASQGDQVLIKLKISWGV